MMRIIPAILAFSALWFAQGLQAQNCGCAEQGNCEFSYPANTTTQVCYDITDAFNNNLASPTQGVCGVYLKFRQGLIGSLNLSLRSPDGTKVQLVGATGACSNCLTPVAIWDILFVANPADIDPDTTTNCALPGIFNGCPATCLTGCWPNGYFTGSYLPFTGSLNDFDSGPANGQWCIEIENTAPVNTGKIFDFEVILCDQSGILCCDADAGNVSFPDFDACTGDSSLRLTPNPTYGPIKPDPVEYGYTYAIFSNNATLSAYATQPDLRTYPAGSYQVCGLSYLLTDAAKLPATGTALTPTALNAALTGPTPPFCGDVRTNCIDIRIYAPPQPVNLRDTICVGDTVRVGNSAFSASGDYPVTLKGRGGCDSLVNLNLTVLEEDSTFLQETLCPGETYTVGNNTFSTTGIHSVVLQNSFGCDSIVTLDLTILAPAITSLTETICSGETYTVGAKSYSTTGVYMDTLQSFYNCDSVVILNLSVVQVNVSIPPPDTLTCLQTSVNLQANATTNFGTLSYVWSNNATSVTTSVSQPGVVTVTASAGGCSVTASRQVFQSAAAPDAVITNSSGNTLTCSLTSIQLSGNTSSSANGTVVYQWSRQSGVPLPNPSATGIVVTAPDTYQLQVTDPVNGCKDAASITIGQNTTPPVANAGANAVLSCQSPVFTLNGSGSSPVGNLGYGWSTLNGHFIPPANINSATINVDQAGTYYLTVTNLLNNCQHTDSVLIEPDTTGPHIVMLLPDGDTITCVLDEIRLDASTSVTNPNVAVQWTGPVQAGPDPLMVNVAQPGTYTLTMTDVLNGCSDSETINIGLNKVTPVADAGPDHAITCTSIGTFTLGGTGTSTGSNYSYEWTSSPGGNFISVTDTTLTRANTPAVYYLTVTDLVSGCSSIDSTQIVDDTNFPHANAGPDLVLTCKDTSFTLVSATDPVIFRYTWKYANGNIITSGVDDTLIVANTPGVYVLTIDNSLCESSDTVVVTESVSAPQAQAGPDVLLDCTSGRATPDGSGSATGVDISYQWTTSNGHFVSGQNTLSPVVDEPGLYLLRVTDEISSCIGFDSVRVSLDSAACMPLVDAGVGGVLNCYNQSNGFTLQASGSAGVNISYQWIALSGSILNSSNPFAPVVTGGEFVFAVTNTTVGLTAYDTVLVQRDLTLPIADAGPNTQLLDCPALAGCYPLDVSNSSQGPGYSYHWEVPGPTGSMCTPPDVLNAEINGEGFYELTVTNLNNGCTAFTAVLIQLNDTAPLANAGADLQMACGETTAQPNGSGSTVGQNISYEWFSTGGNIAANGNTLTPAVFPNNVNDTFHLVVVNNLNLCRDTDKVVVFAPINCFPVCAAAVSGQIDCNTGDVLLNGAGSSSGADVTYQWSTLNGAFCGGENTLSPCASAPGLYKLTVTRTYPNGVPFSMECEVQVSGNIQPPVANAGPDLNLTCRDTVLVLNGNASSFGANIQYQWTTPDGHIISGATTPISLADAVGQYNLQVTDTSNGCTATDLMLVGLDTLYPVANAGPGSQLSCSVAQTTLNGSNSTPVNLVFHWTTSDGEFIAGVSTPTPTVSSAGTYLLSVTIPANGCTDTSSVVVTKDSSVPDPDAGPDLFYTCADTVFTLGASVTGGNSLTYQWSASSGGCITGPSDILQPTVACPGIYRLTVTDPINACTAQSQMKVIDLSAPPVASAGNAKEINCGQPVVMLDGSGSSPIDSLSFLWSTLNGHIVSGETSAVAQVDTAGLYQLIVVHSFTSCRDTSSVVVTIDASIPAITAGQDSTLTCSRTNLKLNGAGSATGNGITHTWTTPDGNIVSGANTLSPLIDRPGIYVLTIEDITSQCIVSDSIVVTWDTLSPIALIDLTSNLTLNCNQSQISLHGDPSLPADSLTYQWSTQDGHILSGVNAAHATVDSAGLYLLTVTHTRNGCTATNTANVGEDFTKPAIQFAPPGELNCKVAAVQLEVIPPYPGGSYNYQWSGPMPITGQTTPTPLVSKVGVYSVTVTDQGNGCKNNSSIVVPENFVTPKAAARSNGSLDCETTLVQVSGEGSSENNVSYQWTTNGSGQIDNPSALDAKVDAPGWYFLTVTRLDNGCQSTDSTEVIARSLPINNALVSLEHPDCVNPEGAISIDSIFGGTPPFSFSLNDDIFITYPLFNYLHPGIYQLTIEDDNGCEWSTQVELLIPGEVFVELGPDLTIRQGESAVLQAETNLSPDQVDMVFWQTLPDSAECPECLNQTVSPEETTTYRIHIMDTNGCMAMDKVTVYVNEDRPFYVPTGFSPNGDGLNDQLMLYAGQNVVLVHTFSIFDRWGNLVFQANDFEPSDPAASWDGNFEGQPMNPAVFVWMVEVEFMDGDREVFYGEVTLVR
jgi:gliding motility-associated-like protein